ncbi:hypothetical protein Tsubulata_017163 [Turnera subulata]|uniref:HMA domain-containing protein n=1 Tax=Turnera subulata TaxID=218843 RepID=A0A9Q0FDM0_9ROSI|nr:hypothetical protein Tsubulata_017163 [Turnera subulata]
MLYKEHYTHMSCALKVDTKTSGWFKTITKVLKKIAGLHYNIDAETGMAYISGRVDPNKILRKIAKAGKHAELCWVQTGKQNFHRDPYWNGHLPAHPSFHNIWQRHYQHPPAHYHMQPYPYYDHSYAFRPKPTWA